MVVCYSELFYSSSWLLLWPVGRSGAVFAFLVDLTYDGIDMNDEPLLDSLAWALKFSQEGLRPSSVSTTLVLSQGQYGLVLGYTGGFSSCFGWSLIYADMGFGQQIQN